MIIAALCVSLRVKFSKKIQAGNTEASWKFHYQSVRSHSHFWSTERMGRWFSLEPGLDFVSTGKRLSRWRQKSIAVSVDNWFDYINQYIWYLDFLVFSQQKCPLWPSKCEHLGEAVLSVLGARHVTSSSSIIIPFLKVVKGIQWITFFYLI